MSTYNSSNFTNDYIFCFNKSQYDMPDATIAWLCSDATYNIEAIYNTVQQKFESLSTYQPA